MRSKPWLASFAGAGNASRASARRGRSTPLNQGQPERSGGSVCKPGVRGDDRKVLFPTAGG